MAISIPSHLTLPSVCKLWPSVRATSLIPSPLVCVRSQRGRRVRRVLPIRVRAVVERAARELRGAHRGRIGRPHHRSAGAEELRAEAPRAAHLVVRPGRVRHLHHVCDRLQRQPSDRMIAEVDFY